MTQKIEKLLLFLLLLLLPSQLGYHTWPSWAFLDSLPIDYLSPTLYLTDIFLISLLLFWLLRSWPVKFINPKFLPLILLYILINILVSLSPFLAIYRWLRLIEYSLFGLYIYKNFNYQLPTTNYALTFSLLWTSLLAWSQFIAKSSLGGLLYWLGERPLSLWHPLVSKVSLGSAGLFLRPYATFPHPNALAAFLLVGSLLLYSLTKTKPALLVLLFTFVTIPLTFSRSVISLEVIFLLLLVLRFRLSRLVKLLTSALLFFLSALLFTIPHPSSFSQRLLLSAQSFTLLLNRPLVGFGVGNFLPALDKIYPPVSLLQPVHNIFLLIPVEFGLPALVLVSYICFLLIKNLLQTGNWKLAIPVLIIISTGLVDHYWLTSHQNSLLLALLFGIVISDISGPKNARSTTK